MKKNNLPVKALLSLITSMLFISVLHAQDGSDFYSNIGKMYVVVGVIVIVFVGLVIFLIRLERRIKKLEREITNN